MKHEHPAKRQTWQDAPNLGGDAQAPPEAPAVPDAPPTSGAAGEQFGAESPRKDDAVAPEQAQAPIQSDVEVVRIARANGLVSDNPVKSDEEFQSLAGESRAALAEISNPTQSEPETAN